MYWEHHEEAVARMKLDMETFSRMGTGDRQEVEMTQDR